MALQSPFFGKRDTDSAGHTPARIPSAPAPHSRPMAAASPSPSVSPAPPTSEAMAVASTGAEARPGADSQLKVGPLIRLKGVEITDCDTLFVEGTVEATMDSRVMEIAPPGRFKGAAQIDVAEIHGLFEGQLTARERLVIHPTGRVTGTVRYGTLSIAEGGQLSGDVGLLDAPASAGGVHRSSTT